MDHRAAAAQRGANGYALRSDLRRAVGQLHQPHAPPRDRAFPCPLPLTGTYPRRGLRYGEILAAPPGGPPQRRRNRSIRRNAAPRTGKVSRGSDRKTWPQELAYDSAFDGITCIVALENVFPEDWPGVLANLHRALRSEGLLYFTVELPEEDVAEVFQAAVATGLPVVPGEYVKEGGYHYYPSIEQVRIWLDADGFGILEEAVGDGYHHILARMS